MNRLFTILEKIGGFTVPKNILLSIIFLSLTLAAVNIAKANQTYKTSGAACHAITPNQARFMEWRESGLVNGDTNRSLYVVCPVITFGNAQEFSVTIGLFNETSQSEAVDCTIREWQGREIIERDSGTVAVRANEYTEAMTWSGGFSEGSHTNVTCLLPPGISIESIQSRSSGGSSGGGSAAEGLVQACVTSPTTYFYSSDTDITMKNGMQINNYDGRAWGSGDSHLTFKIEDGKWYTIREQREFFRLDVLREPDSCFEPDADIITTVSAIEDVAGDKRVYVEGGYVVVDSECAFSQTSLLTYYLPNSYTRYLVDMTTGEDCRVKEAVET